jgi:fibulin 1/2
MDLEQDMKTCIASDPCHTANGGCSHFCDSSLHPICYCPATTGYKLDEDGKTCREEFKCDAGFQLSPHDNRTCHDIDECLLESGICSNGICENQEGSYQCHCHAGYRLSDDKKNCIDFDECSQANSPCSHRCLNLPGTYQCGCPYGQILIDEHICGFSDLCDFNNGGCGKL